MSLPEHLQKYIVAQDYEKYTPVDQASWRYVLRQLKSFLGKFGHESYLEGLEKTGIEIERIPKISDIDKKISQFGWQAMPVSGFIPPAAFMELQAHGVLPIASDMRTLDHLEYTPAPDIVHEAAGHAPMLIHPEFAKYLREYAQVAKKAIISKEDLNLYEAIRELSDVKENPASTSTDIERAQKNLDEASRNISHISEAAELGRMNWWTAEYGLIGSLESPKIFGAGLLSSVGESRVCLSSKVKKIPLTLDCIKMGYDITETQPQLFVTPDFKTLSAVLKQMAEQMAFTVGGVSSVKKAIQAASVNTVELNSGLQISGMCTGLEEKNNQVAYLKFTGPTQLSVEDKQLSGHDKSYHKEGFGTPVGFLENSPDKCLSAFTKDDLEKYGIKQGQPCTLKYSSGVKVQGTLKNILYKELKLVLLTFEDCKVQLGNETLFDPSWGTFDMAVGSLVTSVFAGPADRIQFGATDEFVAKRVPRIHYTDEQKLLHSQYQTVRNLRENKIGGVELEAALDKVLETQSRNFPQDWLLWLESYELLADRSPSSAITGKVRTQLEQMKTRMPEKATAIQDGLLLINN